MIKVIVEIEAKTFDDAADALREVRNLVWAENVLGKDENEDSKYFFRCEGEEEPNPDNDEEE